MERFFENAMYASRWILAPVYFGLSLALIALTIKFFQEIWHVLPNIFSIAEADLILVLLSLVDMTLVGGLLVMVMFSGYENFVSRLSLAEDTEKLDWLGKLDANIVKQKLAISIVAISSIHLLRVFMRAETITDNDKILWYVILHLTFVVSAVLMGWLDKQQRGSHSSTRPLRRPCFIAYRRTSVEAMPPALAPRSARQNRRRVHPTGSGRPSPCAPRRCPARSPYRSTTSAGGDAANRRPSV